MEIKYIIVYYGGEEPMQIVVQEGERIEEKDGWFYLYNAGQTVPKGKVNARAVMYVEYVVDGDSD